MERCSPHLNLEEYRCKRRPRKGRMTKRPEAIGDRIQFGHWETGSMLFPTLRVGWVGKGLMLFKILCTKQQKAFRVGNVGSGECEEIAGWSRV